MLISTTMMPSSRILLVISEYITGSPPSMTLPSPKPNSTTTLRFQLPSGIWVQQTSAALAPVLPLANGLGFRTQNQAEGKILWGWVSKWELKLLGQGWGKKPTWTYILSTWPNPYRPQIGELGNHWHWGQIIGAKIGELENHWCWSWRIGEFYCLCGESLWPRLGNWTLENRILENRILYSVLYY